MKKLFLSGLMLTASIQAFADQTPAQELVTYSGLPLGDIQAMLAKCDSDNQTQDGMYFCAWRDLIVVERELLKIVNQRNAQHPRTKRHWRPEWRTGYRRVMRIARRWPTANGLAGQSNKR